jgi:hypothetical protein
MITRTSTVLAVILSAGIAFATSNPAAAKDRDNQGFGQASVSSGDNSKSKRRFGRRISNGAPGIFGANLQGRGTSGPAPAAFGNGNGSTTPAFGNGNGSTTPAFGNGVGSTTAGTTPIGNGNGSGNRPPPIITVPPMIGPGYATMPNTTNTPPLQGIQQRPPTDKQVGTGYATAPGIINEPTIQQQKPAPATQKM